MNDKRAGNTASTKSNSETAAAKRENEEHDFIHELKKEEAILEQKEASLGTGDIDSDMKVLSEALKQADTLKPQEYQDEEKKNEDARTRKQPKNVLDETDLKFLTTKVKKEEKCVDAKGLKYCYGKAFNNACDTHPEEMEKDCARSCRFCCSDDTTYIGELKCKKFKKLNLCLKGDYQDQLRIICPRTCGFCGRMPAEPPCVRTKFGCCWDGSTAQNHVGTVNDGCPKCQDLYSQKFCLMFKDKCSDKWSVGGTQIRLFCPKTCGKCGPHAVCRDDPRMKEACRQQHHQGACEQKGNFHAMKFSCAKTCNLCDKTTIDCKHTTYGCCSDGKTIAQGYFKEGCKECTDIISASFNCKSLAKHDACHLNADRMRYLCPATCGFCHSE